MDLKLLFKTYFRNVDYPDDSEDEENIKWKTDENTEEDLACKLARRDTIARKEEINKLQQQATSKDMQTRKNDVSRLFC